MHQIIDDCVYLVKRDSDGRLEVEGEHLLPDLGNTVPIVGDRIVLTMDEHGSSSVMEVVSRHLVRHMDRASDTEWTAWFLMVREIEQHEGDELFELVSEHFDKYVRPKPHVPVVSKSTRKKR
jgi:hypothetical protein